MGFQLIQKSADSNIPFENGHVLYRNLQSLVPFEILHNDDSFNIMPPFLNSFLPLTVCKVVTPICDVYSVARQMDRIETCSQRAGENPGIIMKCQMFKWFQQIFR